MGPARKLCYGAVEPKRRWATVAIELIIGLLAGLGLAWLFLAPARPTLEGWTPGRGPTPDRAPSLVGVVPGPPQVQVYHLPPGAGAPPGGPTAHYLVTVVRGEDGRWHPALQEVVPPSPGSAVLTLVLRLPWTELQRRYSTVRLIVR